MFNLWKKNEVVHAILEGTAANRAIPEDATLAQLGDELRHLFGQENINHHRMGVLYNHIVEKKLPEKAGYKDARDYFSKEFADLSQSALTMYGAVAEEFSEPVARRFGVTCLSLLQGYKEAADVEVNPEEPGPTLIEVPDAKGHVTAKPFGQCSVDEMRRALRRKRRPASSKPLPPEVEALAEQVSEAMARRFPKGKGTRLKSLARNEKGKPVMDFKSVPADQLRQFALAILEELDSVSEGPKPPPAAQPS